MSNRYGILLLAICLSLHVPSAWSLGLGDARVESFIGQPLQMRIALLTAPTDDLDSVTVRLATADDFAMIGASRQAISVPLNFSVREGDAASGPYILVTSRLALNDPVLRLVMEVNWASGRMLREYTVFLDPPTVPSRAPEAVTARADRPAEPEPAGEVVPRAPTPQPDQAAEVSEPAPPPATAAEETRAPEPADEPVAEPAAEAGDIAAGEEHGPIRSGETLWSIASNYIGPADMDMNQVMLAIKRKNPDAFMQDNINLLKRGATLEMPAAEEVDEISRAQARELVAQQEAAFRMRSSARTSTPLLAAESRVDAADSAATADDAGPAEESVSRLEIVPASEEDMAANPGTGAVPGGEGAEEVQGDLREELARTEEELISERQQNEYLRERISELEAQLAEAEGASEGLIEDDELANLEDRLQAERLAEAEAVEDETAAETETPAVEAADESPGAMPSVTTSVPADEDRPWYSGPMTWVIVAVILIAGVVGWVFNRRRAEEQYVSDMGDTGTAVSGLKGESEEVLRSPEPEFAGAPEDEEAEQPAVIERRVSAEEPAEFEGVEGGEPEEPEEDRAGGEARGGDDFPDQEAEEEERPVVSLQESRRRQDEDTDVKVLDEDSSDPEIKLDLARAYISMGDKEAARVILEEVLNIGNEQQQSEARSMMDEL